jgi:hypothetical protein
VTLTKPQCNGDQYCCSTCKGLGLQCHYSTQLTPRPDQKKLYIAALETRVAELEHLLSTLGCDAVSDDHWRQKQNEYQHDDEAQQQDAQPEEFYADPGAVRDVSNTTSNLEEYKFTMPMGRVLSSVVKRQESWIPDLVNEEGSPKLTQRSELVGKLGKMFVSPLSASKLLDGFMKNLSTQYPVIHTPRLRELHARRDDDLDIFEESILHLVYASSGRILEAVSSRLSKAYL